MRILGISAFYHDSAAALIDDGRIIAAAQEERFTRKKHDAGFPDHAIEYCLTEAGIGLHDIDFVVFYDKPFLKFERLLETYLAFAPKGFNSFRTAMPIWIKEKLFQKNLLKKEFQRLNGDFDWDNKLLFSEHHLSHGASAFYPSPFEEALVLTMDGVGEWTTTSAAIGRGKELQIFKELFFPHSLGLLYSAITYYIGFKVNSGEYKVMGLAPYGEPVYKDLMLEKLVDLKADGSFRLNMEYFNYCTGLTMTNDRFAKLFGRPVRQKEDDLLDQFHMDMAASVQAVTEEIVGRLVRGLVSETGIHNLCLAGGVALNCVANGKLVRDGLIENIWVQPASGDAGGALGAALLGYHHYQQQPRVVDRQKQDMMQGSYLGPGYAQQDIERRLTACRAKFEVPSSQEEMLDSAASLLADGKVVGWFQGRMEFGPRALGARSILGDPRSESMQKTMNLKIKYRESFRPFAPSVLREDVNRYFETDMDSPYMLLVDRIKPELCRQMSEEESKLFGIDKLNVRRSDLPAITHVDYTARVQTVHPDTNPLYHQLISRFKEKTGCSVVINTSFNVRGEPPVCSPEDAFKCFMGTEMDVLVAGNCILRKEQQDPSLKLDYTSAFDLD
ncbi:MAG: carbamoyltransferase [Gammaproteobacteria bacterium]|nr:carbamoyltransferase [Gammaproteobacteria bacterium]